MSNTLTRLAPDLYAVVDLVGRELTGLIPSVTMDPSSARAALNQDVVIPISPAAAAEDLTPATIPPDTGDQAFSNTTMRITKSRGVPFRWTGDEQRSVNSGPGYAGLRVSQVAQALRTLVNEVEADLAGEYVRASRAFGTAGTTPFGSTIKDLAEVRKILVDNGCPESDLQFVMDTAAGVNFRGLANLYKANEAGNDDLLRQGVLTNLYGFNVRESAQVKQHTKGTGATYQLNGAHALAATTINVDTGSGTIIAGDILTIANGTPADSHKYVVNSALSGGVLGLGTPGLRSAHVDNDAVTVGNSYRANMAFHRSAILLATRLPAVPEEGDMADDRMTITDPRTGLSFEFAVYKGYRRVRYEVGLAWGVKCIKPDHVALMLG